MKAIVRWHGAVRGAAAVVAALLFLSVGLRAEPVAVRYAEGVAHGFLVLRTLDGSTLADGDLIQTARANRVTTRLIFHFKDGSLYDETTVFSQAHRFRLIRDHVVEKGPAFPQPIEMSVDAGTGHVTVRYTDEHGQQKQDDERFDVRADLANGLVPVLLKNVRATAPPNRLSLIVATPRPRMVQLVLQSAGRDRFSTDAEARSARHYVLKVEIGGIAGKLAPLVGKQPPDSHVWILEGEAPAFIRAEQPFYANGPLWRVELTSPRWQKDAGSSR